MPEIMSDQEREADSIANEAIELIDERQLDEAHQLLKKAYALDPNSAKINSYLGYTLAFVEDKVQKGLDLCKKAINSNMPDPLFYRNIGKVYLKLNNKRLAVGAFYKGLSIDKGNRKIYDEFKTLGIRRKPFFSFLARSNFLNKYIGMFTYRYFKGRNQ
jgi:tetratricopeptide (TPR) repeat protein